MEGPVVDDDRIAFGVFYDYRNPKPWRQPWRERYRQLLDQARWVDADLPYESISLSEHHFLDDGYSPGVMAIAAALAVSTNRVRVGTNIMQLPLHHPLRVAEDALTVDALSAGRFRLGVANGYRGPEFEALGTSLRHRRARMEESMQVLRKAFAGEPVAHDGVHFQIPEVNVTPYPDEPGKPEIWMGGNSAPAIDRAARLGDGFLTDNHPDTLRYLEACERQGVTESRRNVCRVLWALIAEDPDAALAQLGEHIVYQINGFIDWGYLDMPYFDDAREIVAQGLYPIIDAAEARDVLREAIADGVREFEFFAVVPGEDVDSSSARLEYIADKVVSELATVEPTA
jgi:alkanesulfonate monooxygenase SsuD/methylene tetrahydromethanopterin reductase-like flavin-dependent oxidoreductase (luciferase family)